MHRFEQTKLWQKTLAKQLEPDRFEREREILRVEFGNFRDKAKFLAAEISRDLPNFTIHDISHIDALWETAELITNGDYELTPAEAFVLGGAFLIHDLGMGLASFPEGIQALKKHSLWKDTITSLLKKRLMRTPSKSEISNPGREIEKNATETMLRLLHAENAERLALISWEVENGERHHLIDHVELRESYGNIIGLIAQSHWWPVYQIEGEFPKSLGAPNLLPSEWIVDPIKIACILRVADAVQVDDRRAPSFLRAIRQPSKLADQHWNFQQKLYKPSLENGRIVYTSKAPFGLNEVDSWWLCYDTLKMIDSELKEVDSLLADTNRQRLKATGVASIEDTKRLSKLVTVKNWEPIDTKIRVGNLPELIKNIGGSSLYGKNMVIPLRELIQNACDAVRARRILESEDEVWGDIVVREGKDEFGQYLEVEDNGVGMSSRVVTGPLLDFGHSFWGTTLMHEELPGLEAMGYQSTGKYG